MGSRLGETSNASLGPGTALAATPSSKVCQSSRPSVYSSATRRTGSPTPCAPSAKRYSRRCGSQYGLAPLSALFRANSSSQPSQCSTRSPKVWVCAGNTPKPAEKASSAGRSGNALSLFESASASMARWLSNAFQTKPALSAAASSGAGRVAGNSASKRFAASPMPAARRRRINCWPACALSFGCTTSTCSCSTRASSGAAPGGNATAVTASPWCNRDETGSPTMANAARIGLPASSP